MTVSNVTDLVCKELGLTKTLPVPGGGNLQYVLEEVWQEGDLESVFTFVLNACHSLLIIYAEISRLPNSSLIHTIIAAPFCVNPFSRKATRSFRISVPDEWYRRSKSRTVSSASTEPSQNTIRRLEALQESDEDEEEAEAEGTAKAVGGTPPSSDRGTYSSNRLSSLFDGWLGSPTARNSAVFSPSPSPERRKSATVSEPMPVQSQHTGSSLRQSISVDQLTANEEEEESEFDHAAFVEVVVSAFIFSKNTNI